MFKKLILIISFIQIVNLGFSQNQDGMVEDRYYDVFTSIAPIFKKVDFSNDTLTHALGYFNRDNGTIYVRVAFLTKDIFVIDGKYTVRSKSSVESEGNKHVIYDCSTIDNYKMVIVMSHAKNGLVYFTLNFPSTGFECACFVR